jgi:hypothetical protein
MAKGVVTAAQPAVRPVVGLACLVAASASACTDPYRALGVLTDAPAVVGISVSVVEGGPHAGDIASLPPDRRRAEVLPLDTVELDALVVDIDGPLSLEDAAWVLCGDPCLPSLERQGERGGALEACAPDSAAHSIACLAGRGERPQLVMPAFLEATSFPRGASAFERVAVIVGEGAGGPTTDECLEQLVHGPRVDMRGCGVGVRQLPYGPEWVLVELLPEDLSGYDFGIFFSPPAIVAQLLPPNAAPQIEQVLLVVDGNTDVEPRSIDGTLDVVTGEAVTIQPVVPLRDQQIMLSSLSENEWIGDREGVSYYVWSDAPGVADGFYGPAFRSEFALTAVEQGPMHLYVMVEDDREGVSWFTLELRVVEG